MRQQQLDGDHKQEKEEMERRKDKLKLKQHKENDISMGMLNNEEPVKKRSKLVLPESQISDQELQQVVKLGRSSEVVREVATENGITLSDSLLSDYSLPTNVAVTPRIPAMQDKILLEAQNVMALTHVDTPLKATPFHSRRNDGTPMNSFNTPASSRLQNGVLATPVRDKLNINPDDVIAGSETPVIQK
ncbi:PREDICTED: cell division cycle 5-like protein isoform X2 [Polistes dominula]|uniref:Cell division cycle 5-like protein isoform X2 n=1 Tax=Polistes dominula TaxID=743375 RepID=A0ABM1JA59_POLDO|nr:PREDICTED: cell division cycle 5-like protein isoform X2 [Polistes dominula]